MLRLGGLLVFLFFLFGFSFFAAEFYAVAQFVDGSAQSTFAHGSCASSHKVRRLVHFGWGEI